MFFTTEITVPFSYMKEVSSAYPDWKLRLKPGDEGFLYLLAADGDQKAAEFFDRIQNFPTDAQFPTVQEGIKKIISEKSAILLSENELRLYNKYSLDSLTQRLPQNISTVFTLKLKRFTFQN